MIGVRPRKAPADDALHDEMISGSGRTHTDSKIEFPLRPEVDVNTGEKLLLLISRWIEAGERAVGCVVLQPAGNLFGEVIADFYIGRELHSLVHAGPVK